MSTIGTKRTSGDQLPMSFFWVKWTLHKVCNAPQTHPTFLIT